MNCEEREFWGTPESIDAVYELLTQNPVGEVVAHRWYPAKVAGLPDLLVLCLPPVMRGSIVLDGDYAVVFCETRLQLPQAQQSTVPAPEYVNRPLSLRPS